jgi:Zn-dependent M28 family amino/carboxypeptidase
MRSWRLCVVSIVLATAAISSACARASDKRTTSDGDPAPARAARSTSTLPPVAFPRIDGRMLMNHIRVLSSDKYGGRLPGTNGEDLTVAYIADQFSRAGLKPGAPDGTFFQKVPLVAMTPDPSMVLTFTKGRVRSAGAARPGEVHRLKYLDDFVAWTRHESERAGIDGSQLVFVGYGVQAPEFNWDDYKGVDVKGKMLVMLVNDPPVPDPADHGRLDPKVFGGAAMTYYGRWTYKYDIAAQKGAAGVLLVHETAKAGYPWSVVRGFGGERFDLAAPGKNMDKAAVEGWITLEQAHELFVMAGRNLDALEKQAATRDFEPVPLDVTASVSFANSLREIDSRNVVGRVEGSDPALKDQCIVYTAHWDHFGSGPAGIYHGAIDNASGVAGLIEIGRAFAHLPAAPKRSVLLVAVTGEEQGLLGSRYYVEHPAVPLARTLADINMDALNVHGRTHDVTVVGLGESDLDDYARLVAERQGRILRPDAEPEKGFYYRSDHFEFAKAGVPALDPEGGMDFVGKPADYGGKLRDYYTEHDYHRPSDIIRSDWDLSGTVEDLQLYWMVGYAVAQSQKFPEWKPGAEFKAARDAQLASGRHAK